MSYVGNLSLVRFVRLAYTEAQIVDGYVCCALVGTQALVFKHKILVAVNVKIYPVLACLHRLHEGVAAAKFAIQPQLNDFLLGGVG